MLQQKLEALDGKLKELATIQQEIRDLQVEIGAYDVFSGSPGAKAPKVKAGKRGRPAGSKNSKAKKDGPSDGGSSCAKTIETILKRNKTGLRLQDLTKAVLEAGYETSSKSPANVVYQSARKLVNDGALVLEEHLYKINKAA